MTVLVTLSALCLVLAFLVGLLPWAATSARWLVLLGLVLSLCVAVAVLPHGINLGSTPPLMPDGRAVVWHLDPAAVWLYAFGAAGAVAAVIAGSPIARGRRGGLWSAGVAASVLGAVATMAVQNGPALLVSWEVMSLGGAFMLLSESASPEAGRSVLFMLGLLELGSLALMGALAWLGLRAGGEVFGVFVDIANGWPGFLIGLLLLIGFGAKLGLLPFYEWFPAAYASGSGATGAVLSGVVLNAAFFALARGLLEWVDGDNAALAYVLLAVAVVTAILTALYAFQEDDWRELLSLSTAENAALSVTLLGAVLLFRGAGHPDLAGLAWGAALVHLAAHALAKSGLFLTADQVVRATGQYDLSSPGLARGAPLLAVGALVLAASLAAVPPTPGFVSEWFGFETLFQGFHLNTLAGRVSLAASGAGIALTAAIALATYIKVIGIGLLGRAPVEAPRPSGGLVVALLAAATLTLSIGLPWWLSALDVSVNARFGAPATSLMRHAWLLVPLTPDFAFISPTKLAIAIPFYALIPGMLIFLLARRRYRRTPVWYGGLQESATPSATTSLTFANALRRYYSFVYRPREFAERGHQGSPYFVHRLTFSYENAPLFGPWVFTPCVRIVTWLGSRIRALQSGYLNFYLTLVGAALILSLVFVLL